MVYVQFGLALGTCETTKPGGDCDPNDNGAFDGNRIAATQSCARPISTIPVERRLRRRREPVNLLS